jgi:hypothetical protein
MPQQESQRNAEELLLPKYGASLSNPQDSLSGKVSDNIISNESTMPDRPFRVSYFQLWKRTLVLILVPVTITVYFWMIRSHFLMRDPENPVKYGGASEISIYYSWFLIGVFGLGLSKYGLVGVEDMLQISPSQNSNSEHSWSGPSGWIKRSRTLRWGHNRVSSRLWYSFAFLSLLPYVALPLSGLCLEQSEGYVRSSAIARVIGHKWEDFNRRQEKYYYSGAAQRWETGSPATVPGFGMIYTPEHLQRGQYSTLQQVPNTLPLDEGIPDMFLAPQAKTPISGNSWGLRTGYTCKIVENASEFTILGQKSLFSVYTPTKAGVKLTNPSGQVIYAFTGDNTGEAVNVLGYIEMGFSNASRTTYDGTEPSSFDPGNMDNADVFEYLLWQMRKRDSYDVDGLKFDSTLDPIVKGLGQPFIQATNGSYVFNETFFKIQNGPSQNSSSIKDYLEPSDFNDIISTTPPIGIRCRVVSTLGTAELNPAQSTFRLFKQISSPLFNQGLMESETPRLGNIAMNTMLDSYLQLFTSANSPPPITVSNSYHYENFMQPESLRRSIMQAFASDALQLMYDGTYGFGGAWDDTNLTSSRPGKILTVGILDPLIPAIVFTIWAAGCVLLAVLFGIIGPRNLASWTVTVSN